MYKKLTEQEIEMMEVFYQPKAFTECLFADGTPRNWNDKGKCITVRPYQLPFFGFDSLLEDDNKLTDLENFRRRIAVGTRILTSGRKIGKSFIGLVANILLKLIHYRDLEMTMASFDEKHVSKILDGVREFLVSHNFFKTYKKSIRGNPEYQIKTNNGNELFGINETIKGKNPGECVDEQTEVLTDKGWKFFKDLTYFDKVLSLNDKREGVYCKIQKIFKHQYNGIMKRVHSKNSEFLVTPNHKLIVEEHEELKYKSLDRDSFFKQIYMLSTFNWKGLNKTQFKLRGISNFQYKEYITSYENWVKFVAWYLSEGSLVSNKDSHYRIHISQKKHCGVIEKLLKDMNLKFYKNEHDNGCFNYVISNKLIHSHLDKYFGKVKTKRIPKYFKNLSKELLYTFVEEYLKGDGTVKSHKNRPNPYRGLCTSLKILADDLQEVSQKAGYKTNMTIDKCRKNSFGKEPIYWITLCRSVHSVFQRDDIKDVPYNGIVYCVNTEPYHNIFIRRNGSVVWTSNSWWGHHTFINFQDEIQAETEEAYNKKIDAVSDFGVMEILCGITLISKNSPLGRVIRDRENKKHLIRLPQYVSKLFDEQTKQNRIRAYGGEQSHSYKINVAAELVENAQGVFDMGRLMSNYNKKRTIKRFEVTKDNFKDYQRILVLEPIYNATKTYVASDVGDSAATEITVFGKINGKYELVYNITTYRLSLTKELPDLMEYIFRQVAGHYMAVDATIMGKPVYEILDERLNEKVLDEKGNVTKVIKRVYWVAFNEDIVTGIEKDDKGRAVKDRKGEVVKKTTPALHFSVMRLQQLFFDKKFDIPEDDFKFELQFSCYISIISGSKVIYDTTGEDHYVQSFEVFALLEWLTEQLPSIGAVSERKKLCSGVYN